MDDKFPEIFEAMNKAREDAIEAEINHNFAEGQRKRDEFVRLQRKVYKGFRQAILEAGGAFNRDKIMHMIRF